MPTHLITGAGSGIGAVLAQRLHARGDHLVLTARSAERAADLEAAYPGCTTLVVDLADPAALQLRLATATSQDQIPVLDSITHSAGVVHLAPVEGNTLSATGEQLAVNLMAPMILTRELLSRVRRGTGTVVFLNSSAGLSASARWSVYAASKFGLRGFADALRAEQQERREHGFRVSTILPSRTATPMQEKVHEQEGKTYDESMWLDSGTVVDIILHVLDLPAGATIPEVTVRPVVPRAT